MRVRIPEVLRPLARHALTRPWIRALLFSGVVYSGLFLHCRHALWRDPHSAFFNDKHVYELDYSRHRIEEANKFIQMANATPEPNRDAEGTPESVDEPVMGIGEGGHKPVLCAAFVTVRRERKQYFPEAIGSMLAGLYPQERAALNLTVLFADTEPMVHPNWKDPWVQNVVDHAETYTGLTEAEWEEAKKAEREKNYYVKGVFDYVYALSRCLEDTTAPYIAVFEDDIIFADGWMTRSLLALQAIQRHYASSLAPKVPETPSCPRHWLYLRLFYTETALKWERSHDYWYSYLPWTLALSTPIVAVVLIALRLSFPHTLRAHLDVRSIAVLSLVTAPSLFGFVFMAGKYGLSVRLQDPESPFAAVGSLGGTGGAGPVSLPPAPLRQAGVVNMNGYGCCSQALIYPRHRAEDLVLYLRDRHDGQTDSMIEEYADQRGFDRFALGRQQVQHIGLHSSRGNTPLNAQSTWAFWFEENKGEKLKRRHDQDIGKIDWSALRQTE
ncbi:hypothetical protein H2201_008473 [Coniosporium apollinis]|uniref:Integral membrane protein n=1 Tax=Coniosporium apollinis TaxID=61459 RepID=A0ABQ9NG37_9PEZI|nr:hypothetical protein H2201_008473 [Coniosporium apollinis]